MSTALKQFSILIAMAIVFVALLMYVFHGRNNINPLNPQSGIPSVNNAGDLSKASTSLDSTDLNSMDSDLNSIDSDSNF